MAFHFEYYSPTKVYFGKGTEEKVGVLIKGLGYSKILIHYGSGSVIKSGLLARIKHSLDTAGLSYTELGGVVPNPILSKVQEGIALCQKENVDFLLAVGGGSVIDSAKAIAYALAEPGKDVWELFEHTRTARACFPLGAVVTIAAAGSETSSSCVITNEKTGEKRSYGNHISRPKFAVMNPELTMTLPDYQTASGCVDIMMHTMERYFTNGGNMDLTDSIAEGLLRTVIENAKILCQNPQDYHARAEIMWAGSLSHNGLTGCGNDGGDFMSHKLEHELGGMFDVTHGAGLAAIWPSWARYVYRDCLDRFVKYALRVMQITPGKSDEETALRGIAAMEDFYHEIGMPITLKELGIEPTDEQIENMAASCIRASGGPKGSAKVLHREDMSAIYNAARE